MVFSSPFNNIRGFVHARPPLVVFTLCLMAFAVTTLSLAYFVEHKDTIQNVDAERDWVSFLNYLQSLELCVTQTEGPVNISSFSENEVGNISLSFTGSLTAALSHNITNVQGYLPLNGWTSDCVINDPLSDLIKVSLSVGHNGQNSSNHSVCITFTGPRTLLPAVVGQPVCSSSPVPQGNWGRIEGRTTAALGEQQGWCQDGSVGRLFYRTDDHFSVFLTIRDRSIINLHLIHTSYFLLVMAITIVCYAMLKGKPKAKQIPLDKVPLDSI